MPKGNKGMLLLVCLNVALAQPDLALSQLEVASAQPDVVLAQLDVVLAQLDVVLALPDVALDQLDVALAHLDKLSYGWMTQPDIWWVAHVILESALGQNPSFPLLGDFHPTWGSVVCWDRVFDLHLNQGLTIQLVCHFCSLSLIVMLDNV